MEADDETDRATAADLVEGPSLLNALLDRFLQEHRAADAADGYGGWDVGLWGQEEEVV